jgi:hypothetical protein
MVCAAGRPLGAPPSAWRFKGRRRVDAASGEAEQPGEQHSRKLRDGFVVAAHGPVELVDCRVGLHRQLDTPRSHAFRQARAGQVMGIVAFGPFPGHRQHILRRAQSGYPVGFQRPRARCGQ